jgi:hypothetical protein
MSVHDSDVRRSERPDAQPPVRAASLEHGVCGASIAVSVVRHLSEDHECGESYRRRGLPTAGLATPSALRVPHCFLLELKPPTKPWRSAVLLAQFE